MGVESVSTYGLTPNAPSCPNLDALAAEGILFRTAWSYPACSPTRAALQTGRYGFRTGVGTIITETFSVGYGLQLSEVTLPKMLDQGTGLAYAHGAFGKWHLGTLDTGGNLAPNLTGYSHFAGSLTNLRDGNDYFQWTRVVDGVEEVTTNYATSDVVDSTLSFIGSVQEPWFCQVNFHSAHTPFHAPPAELHNYVLDQNSGPREQYEAMVQTLDTELGRLLAGLGPDYLDDTFVIFMGDNGTPGLVGDAAYPTAGLKGTVYEGGMHVPFIVAGPPVGWQGESQELVSVVDVFKTIADVAGIDLATEYPGLPIDGVSLAPHLQNPSRKTTRFLFTERFAPNGPGGPIPDPPCPDPLVPVCQNDVGFQGPGNLSLTMCGNPLYGATAVPLRLDGAPPGALSFLGRGPAINPVPYRGGIIAPYPPDAFIIGFADENGSIVRDIQSYTVPFTTYFQAVCLDPSTPEGVAFSNVVEAVTGPTHLQAARDSRYKLIVNVPVCLEEFYDLENDPGEQIDLLELGPLGTEALMHYEELKAFLDSLH